MLIDDLNKGNAASETVKALIQVGTKPNSQEIMAGLSLFMKEPKHLLALIEHGNHDVVSSLISYQNVDVNVTDSKGATPLMHLLNRPIDQQSTETLQRLIGYGANVHVADEKGMTPLHYAAIKRNLDATHILVENGADQSVRNKDLQTPIESALIYSPGQNEAVTFLIKPPQKEMGNFKPLPKLPAPPPLVKMTRLIQTAENPTKIIISAARAAESTIAYITPSSPISDSREVLLESVDVSKPLYGVLSVPMSIIDVQSAANNIKEANIAFDKSIHEIKDQIDHLDKLVAAADNSSIKEPIVAKKEELYQQLQEVSVAKEKTIQHATLEMMKKTMWVGQHSTRALLKGLMFDTEYQSAGMARIGGLGCAMISSLSVYQNWNEIKNIEEKVKQLALVNTSLLANYSELIDFSSTIPDGFEKRLTLLKLKQLEQKTAHITKEMDKLNVLKATSQYSTIGHQIAIALGTLGVLTGAQGISSSAGAVRGISTLSPMVVGGSYAIGEKFKLWGQSASDAVYGSLEKLRLGYENVVISALLPVLEILEPTTSTVLNLNQEQTVFLEQSTARNLGLPVAELQEELARLDHFLNDPLKGKANNETLKNLLIEAGIDVNSYSTERRKLILELLNN
jgi:hypothetical protein